MIQAFDVDLDAFSNTFGVFEGGGVRGIALAGAYQSAHDNGVRFGAVAGTSAGSIIAALIAAGARPEKIAEFLRNKQFQDLLCEVDKNERLYKRPLWSRPARWVLPARYSDRLTLWHDGALHGVRELKKWVDEILCEVTGKVGPLQFADLDLPLYVVSTNLKSSCAYVWNEKNCGPVTVAQAVVSSCAIPGFFPPQVLGNGVFVDGGMLSNLPAFVFSRPEVQEQLQSCLAHVLAFRLAHEGKEERRLESAADFVRALLDSEVAGTTQLQVELQPHVHTIVIPTGDVRATDFHRMNDGTVNTLYDNGVRAARNFFLHRATARRPVRKTYSGLEEYLLLVCRALEAGAAVTILSSKADTLLRIVPSLMYARRSGAHVTVVLSRASEDRDAYARWLLNGLGVTLAEASVLPWEGFIVERSGRGRRAAILGGIEGMTPADAYTERSVATYADTIDSSALDVLEAAVGELQYAYLRQGEPGNLVLRRLAQPSRLEAALRQVPQYGKADVREGDVSLADVRSLCKFVKEYRLIGVKRLHEISTADGVEPFESSTVGLLNKGDSIVTPPVFERYGDRFVVIDGVARCHLARMLGRDTIRGVVIENGPGLPEKVGRPLAKVRLTSRTVSAAENFPTLPREDFREIESHVHDPLACTPLAWRRGSSAARLSKDAPRKLGKEAEARIVGLLEDAVSRVHIRLQREEHRLQRRHVRANVFLPGEDPVRLRIVLNACVNMLRPAELAATLLPGEGVTGKAFASGHAEVITGIRALRTEPDGHTKQSIPAEILAAQVPDLEWIVAVPLRQAEEIIGVLNIDGLTHPFVPDELQAHVLESLGDLPSAIVKQLHT